ncbi:MAG: hypothetical protein GF410_15745 [Chitinivibrionales bacterium]|nr:hypothetical protein [Chitinivibrionales bacterium]
MRSSISKRYKGYLKQKVRPLAAIDCAFTSTPEGGDDRVNVWQGRDGTWHARRPDFECAWRGCTGRARIYRSVFAFDGMLRVMLATRALENRKALMHAAAAASGSKGFAFPGRSGSGKTTVTGLVRGLRVLNDEIVCLEADGRRPRVWATPFWGEMGTGPAAPKPYDLARILFLKKGAGAPACTRIDKQEALVRVMQCMCSFGKETALAARALEVARSLVERVPAFELHFGKDTDVATTVAAR